MSDDMQNYQIQGYVVCQNIKKYISCILPLLYFLNKYTVQ